DVLCVCLSLTPIFVGSRRNLGFGDVVGLVVDNVQGAGGVGVQEINGAFENVTVGPALGSQRPADLPAGVVVGYDQRNWRQRIAALELTDRACDPGVAGASRAN